MAVVSPHRRARVAVRSRLVHLALAFAVVGLLGSGASGRPHVADAVVAPRCAYADTLSRYRRTSDWYRSLLDTRYRLGGTYAPVDLVRVTRSGAAGSGSVRHIALADLGAMFRAARAAGAPFAVQSAYRSYSTQVATFRRWVQLDGYAAALLGSARPGHSEHQLGTALDLKTPGGPNPWDVADWGQTRAGAWLARNSWRYGWVLSYPKNRVSVTCYQYEPWHFRYYGRIIAGRIHRSGLVARQWLYVHGTTGTWTGGSPNATPKPTPSPTPTPSPVPTPDPSPSATPVPDPTASPSDDPGASPSDTPSASPDATQTPTDPPTESPSDAASPSDPVAP
jgi:D-alanyl-D-alanine carboxypeptidase